MEQFLVVTQIHVTILDWVDIINLHWVFGGKGKHIPNPRELELHANILHKQKFIW